jgi:hypothetical protein
MNQDSQYRRKLLIEIAATFVVVALAVILLNSLGAFKRPGGTHKITFKASASGGYALLTYDARVESMLESTIINTPWQRSFEVPSGSQVYLTAANPSQTGKLYCEILLDRKPWKYQEIASPKDGVACAGIVP